MDKQLNIEFHLSTWVLNPRFSKYDYSSGDRAFTHRGWIASWLFVTLTYNEETKEQPRG